MVQCEVLQGEFLSGLPADEDPATGPDDIPPNGPFAFFGFGQVGPDAPSGQPAAAANWPSAQSVWWA